MRWKPRPSIEAVARERDEGRRGLRARACCPARSRTGRSWCPRSLCRSCHGRVSTWGAPCPGRSWAAARRPACTTTPWPLSRRRPPRSIAISTTIPPIAATPRIAAGNAYWLRIRRASIGAGYTWPGGRIVSSTVAAPPMVARLLPTALACAALSRRAAAGTRGAGDDATPTGLAVVMTEYEYQPRNVTVRSRRSDPRHQRGPDRAQPEDRARSRPAGGDRASWPGTDSFLPGDSETLCRRPAARPLRDGLHGARATASSA